MPNRLYALPKKQQGPLSAVQTTSSTRRTQRRVGLSLLGAMLMLVVLLLSGCHTLPVKPCDPLPPVTMPALLQPLPPVSYLLQSQQSDENSRKKLMGTLTTSKP